MQASFASRQPTVEQKMQGLAAAQESSANWFAAYTFAQDFFSDQKPDERILPSACEKIACTESIKLAWPVAISRGEWSVWCANCMKFRG